MTDHEQLNTALSNRKGTRHRTSGQERWLDFHCPVHDDRHRSASYQPETGSLICRVCGKLEPAATLRALGRLPDLGHPGVAGPTARSPRVLLGEQEFPYHFPSGELSHHKVRRDYSDGSKQFLQRSPSGEWSLPDPCWPLYGDLGLPLGAHLVLVEGERKVDVVACQQALLGDVPVHALTAGSQQDLQRAVEILIARLRELQPASLLLWPDSDEPGRKAMAAVSRRLEQAGIAHLVLDPERYRLGLKEDVVDFLEQGQSLSGLLQQELARAAPRLLRPADVADKILVLASGLAIFPGTQTPCRLDASWAKTLWRKVAGATATSRQAEELLDALRVKTIEDPTPEHWRIRAGRDHTYWRPGPNQLVYRVSASGIDRESEIGEGVLLCGGQSFRPDTVNLDDDGETLWNVLQSFGINGHEHDMIEAWLVAAFTGQEVPVLLLRGDAGSGKSTLARFLVSLIDPTQPELDGSGRIMDDQRQLIRTLQRSPTILMDNVSSLPASVEDLLCKLVTGYSISLRTLYSDSPESIRFKRAMVITAVSWEAYRGDLTSRMLLAQIRRDTASYVSEEETQERLDALMPAVRGWIMKRCAEYYARRAAGAGTAWSFRVASIGRVLNALGRDQALVAADEAHAKAQLLNQNDPWFQSLVAIWDQFNEGGEFLLSTTQIVDLMLQNGVERSEAPVPSSRKFAAWLGDKSAVFRDHGFRLEHVRTEKARGWWFRRVQPFRVVQAQ